MVKSLKTILLKRDGKNLKGKSKMILWPSLLAVVHNLAMNMKKGEKGSPLP